MKKKKRIGYSLPSLPAVHLVSLKVLRTLQVIARLKVFVPATLWAVSSNKVPPIGPLGSTRKAPVIVAPLPPCVAYTLAALTRGVSARGDGLGSVINKLAKGAPTQLPAKRLDDLQLICCGQTGQAPPLSTVKKRILFGLVDG